MRLNLAVLLGLVVVTGCSDNDHSSIPSAGVTGGPMPTDRNFIGTDESRSFTLKLPDGANPREKEAIKVVIRNESARSVEPFQIRIVSLVPGEYGKSDRELSLGTQDIYKRLDNEETTTVYLDEVVLEAWSKRGDHYEIRLDAQAEPARADRPRPNINLKVVSATVVD
jgi:hypothetical protein